VEGWKGFLGFRVAIASIVVFREDSTAVQRRMESLYSAAVLSKELLTAEDEIMRWG